MIINLVTSILIINMSCGWGLFTLNYRSQIQTLNMKKFIESAAPKMVIAMQDFNTVGFQYGYRTSSEKIKTISIFWLIVWSHVNKKKLSNK